MHTHAKSFRNSKGISYIGSRSKKIKLHIKILEENSKSEKDIGTVLSSLCQNKGPDKSRF